MKGIIHKESKANRKSQQKYENIALVETIIYIEEVLQENHAELAPFIKLSMSKNIINPVLRN